MDPVEIRNLPFKFPSSPCISFHPCSLSSLCWIRLLPSWLIRHASNLERWPGLASTYMLKLDKKKKKKNGTWEAYTDTLVSRTLGLTHHTLFRISRISPASQDSTSSTLKPVTVTGKGSHFPLITYTLLPEPTTFLLASWRTDQA